MLYIILFCLAIILIYGAMNKTTNVPGNFDCTDDEDFFNH